MAQKKLAAPQSRMQYRLREMIQTLLPSLKAGNFNGRLELPSEPAAREIATAVNEPLDAAQTVLTTAEEMRRRIDFFQGEISRITGGEAG